MLPVGDPNFWLAVVVGQWLVLFFLVIYVLIINSRFRKLRHTFNKLTDGVTTGSLENVLEQWLEQQDRSQQQYVGINDKLTFLEEEIQRKKGNVGIVRFNAFANEGSDLSFSVAVLDDLSNGFVLTSIYGREESRVYAKPIEGGASKYHLTQEENEAIGIAKQKVRE